MSAGNFGLVVKGSCRAACREIAVCQCTRVSLHIYFTRTHIVLQVKLSVIGERTITVIPLKLETLKQR